MASVARSFALSVSSALRDFGPVYYCPINQYAHVKAAGITTVHQQYGAALARLNDVKAAGLKIDVEIPTHAEPATRTPSAFSNIVTQFRVHPAASAVRRILMIDEPDHPAYAPGTWDMGLYRDIYAASKAVAPDWPVWVLVRADRNTFPQALPWFANNVSDGISWDPYLAHYPGTSGEDYIREECLRIRGSMPAPKPLTCILQTGTIPWAVANPGDPVTIPTVEKVRSMGLTAISAGASDCGIWNEHLPVNETTTALRWTNPTWMNIGQAVGPIRAA